MTASNNTLVGPRVRAGVGTSDLRAFLDVVVRRPGLMGAFAPSSPAVAATVARVVPRADKPVVVELGAGTGAISDAIGARLTTGARHVALEIDPDLADHLRHTRPNLEVIEGDAANLGAHLTELVPGPVDAVVSSLPWTLLAADQQTSVLRQVGQVLEPNGAFTAIQHLTAVPARARAFRRRLEREFDEVVVTKTVWRSLPPARVYICRRPIAP